MHFQGSVPTAPPPQTLELENRNGLEASLQTRGFLHRLRSIDFSLVMTDAARELFLWWIQAVSQLGSKGKREAFLLHCYSLDGWETAASTQGTHAAMAQSLQVRGSLPRLESCLLISPVHPTLWLPSMSPHTRLE